MTQGEQGQSDGFFSMTFHPGGMEDTGTSRRPPSRDERTSTRDQEYERQRAELEATQHAKPNFGIPADPPKRMARISVNGHHIGELSLPAPQDTIETEDNSAASRDLEIRDDMDEAPANGLDAISVAGANLPGPGTDLERYEEPPTPPTRAALMLRGKVLPAINQPYALEGVQPVQPMALANNAAKEAANIVRAHLPQEVAQHPVLGTGIIAFAEDMGKATYVRHLKDAKAAESKPKPIKDALDARMPDRAVAMKNGKYEQMAVEAGKTAASDTVALRPTNETTRKAFGNFGATRFMEDFDGRVLVDLQEVAPLIERNTPDALRSESSRVRDQEANDAIPENDRVVMARFDQLGMVARNNNTLGPEQVVAFVSRDREKPDTYYAGVIEAAFVQAPGAQETASLGRAGAVEIDVHTAFAMANRLGAAAIAASSEEETRAQGDTEGTERRKQVIIVGDMVQVDAWRTNREAIGRALPGIQPRYKSSRHIDNPTIQESEDIIDADVTE